MYPSHVFFFFFQAEDGIRDYKVTGVQTCALPISTAGPRPAGAVARGRGEPGAAAAHRGRARAGHRGHDRDGGDPGDDPRDRKSTRLNSSHLVISYAVFCLKKKKNKNYNE